jgi:hypothetical protein
MWNGKKALLALVAIVAFALPSLAQTGKGLITGAVSDSSGGALIGAQINIESTGASTVSDAQGQFFIYDLAPGSYAVTVTYVGFKVFTQTVNVTAGKAASVEAKLEVESQNLQVLVTAERASGEAEEINRQRSADNVLQVLTSDVITSLPNANIADALGRDQFVSTDPRRRCATFHQWPRSAIRVVAAVPVSGAQRAGRAGVRG